ncbi:hypothetical protein [Streptomyces phaeochromogenes]|uniref:hypothetical protein n=1 Tax=Streptomyces phaeochromogenes TaxID=1923 RepID=UPI003863FD5E|nr:hypothetical protein OHB08_01305 [Streptomyces phaeochromogenes]
MTLEQPTVTLDDLSDLLLGQMRISSITPQDRLEESVRHLRNYLVESAASKRSSTSVSLDVRDEDGEGEGDGDGEGDAKGEGDGNGSTLGCGLPAFAPGAHDLVKFHQRIVALNLAELEDVTIACARVSTVRMSLGFVQRFEQKWEYGRTTLGRPVSYIALAPLERRRVQVAQKRKTNLSRSDRTKRSSRRTYDSASTTKASNSATNSSTSRNKWSASASGSYGLGGVGWGAKVEGSLEGSSEEVRQTALEKLVEETQKSSTEVMAETETTTTIGLQTSFEHIEEHQLVNPYADRSVLFSLFELVDEFCVRTSTAGFVPCLIFDFDPISSDARRLGPSVKFDDSFVSTHRQFLRIALLDDTLVDFLDSQDALEIQSIDTGEISANAARCMGFLFSAIGVFAPASEGDYQIDESFDVALSRSGFTDAQNNDMTDLYLLMAGVRFMYLRDARDLAIGGLEVVEFLRRMIEYVIVLYNGLSGWSGVSADNKRKMHDGSHLTEQFRRIPAFRELAEQLVVTPLKLLGEEPSSGTETSDGAEGEDEGPESATTSTTTASTNPRTTKQARVVNHLNCFGRYYTEEYLQFLYEWTGVATIVELMASLDDAHRSLIDFLDFERSFVDGTAWIVPFAEAADAQAVADAFLEDGGDLSTLKPIDTDIAITMPANGVHVEAAPGQCLLPGLPGDSSGWPLPPAAYPWTGPGDFQ